MVVDAYRTAYISSDKGYVLAFVFDRFYTSTTPTQQKRVSFSCVETES